MASVAKIKSSTSTAMDFANDIKKAYDDLKIESGETINDSHEVLHAYGMSVHCFEAINNTLKAHDLVLTKDANDLVRVAKEFNILDMELEKDLRNIKGWING